MTDVRIGRIESIEVSLPRVRFSGGTGIHGPLNRKRIPSH